MNQVIQPEHKKQKEHQEYDCLLSVDRELLGIRVKAVERYEIDTRLYY